MESYQKIQQKYNKEVKDILNGYVVIEEKVDGSQFRIEVSPEGVIKTARRILNLEQIQCSSWLRILQRIFSRDTSHWKQRLYFVNT